MSKQEYAYIDENLPDKAQYIIAKEIAKKNGICERTFRYRVSIGYTYQEACSLPLYERRGWMK